MQCRTTLVGDALTAFLYHMRKAGGTSLRRYLAEWAAHTGRSVDVVEGLTLGSTTPFLFETETVHLTSLREPIARLKSAYRFEGRWPQTATTRTPESAQPFAVWVRETAVSDPERPGWLWQCSSNYYVKSLTGWPRGGVDVDQRRTNEAKRILERFEIVLITEELSSTATQQYLKRRLDFDGTLTRARPGTKAASPVESDNDLFDESTMLWLRDLNRWDTELYEFATELHASRLD